MVINFKFFKLLEKSKLSQKLISQFGMPEVSVLPCKKGPCEGFLFFFLN